MIVRDRHRANNEGQPYYSAIIVLPNIETVTQCGTLSKSLGITKLKLESHH